MTLELALVVAATIWGFVTLVRHFYPSAFTAGTQEWDNFMRVAKNDFGKVAADMNNVENRLDVLEKKLGVK